MAGSSPLTADPLTLAAARTLAAGDPAVEIALIAPAEADLGPVIGRRLTATSVLAGGGDDTGAVRASRLASVRVAAKEVRDGRADVWVAGGPPGPATVAARFSFGTVRGVASPVTAWLLATEARPLVLVAGDDPVGDPVPGLIGSVVARTVLGIGEPRVGALGASGIVVTGGPLDVAVASTAVAVAVLETLAATGRPTAPALLLGLTGLTVFDPVGGATRNDLLTLAVVAVRAGLLPATIQALGGLVADRRTAAGLGDGAQSRL